MRTISVIGSGALASIFAKELKHLLSDDYEIRYVFSKTLSHAQALADVVGAKATDRFEDLLENPSDFVVEFAGIGALKAYAKDVLSHNMNLVMASAGALADERFKADLQTTAKTHNVKLYVAGGAIGGLDLMQTFALMGKCETMIESTKAPKSLNCAPYLAGRTLSETDIEKVFEGGVKEAIAGFPKNVNVAVTASAASDNPATTVKLVSTPGVSTNTHTITLKNELMTATIQIASKPDPQNPKSSISTAWSVLALLKNLASPVVYY